MTNGSLPPRSTTQGREVTLLPRHWAWLAAQPCSASAALRRLVEEARRDPTGHYRLRQAQEACYAYLRGEGGDRPGFEDAVRALFANDAARFQQAVASWPEAIRQRARELAAPAMATATLERTGP